MPVSASILFFGTFQTSGPSCGLLALLAFLSLLLIIKSPFGGFLDVKAIALIEAVSFLRVSPKSRAPGHHPQLICPRELSETLCFTTGMFADLDYFGFCDIILCYGEMLVSQ